jgi:hypothetical protein
MDPIQKLEIFEVSKDNTIKKISQLNYPSEAMNFLKNYIDNTQNFVEVVFMGPDNYIEPWVDKANTFEFVKAYQNQMGEN